MTKIDYYLGELGDYIKSYIDEGDFKNLFAYLLVNSNLPGRRANLELANALVNLISQHDILDLEKLWKLSLLLSDHSVIDAPVNSKEEFLPFCGVWAIGAIGAKVQEYYYESLILLKRFAIDPRWRLREAVAFGLQELIKAYNYRVVDELTSWIKKDHWLIMRAVVAGIAHPKVLEDERVAKEALEIHDKIFKLIYEYQGHISEEFKILRKGLCYTLSVIVSNIPLEGFKFIAKHIKTNNNHIRFIINENLKKNRLVKNFSQEITQLKKDIE